MIDPQRIKTATFLNSLDWVPPAIRDELLSDEKLGRDFGLALDPDINFGDSSVSFKRSELFAAARAAGSSPGKSQRVSDEAGVQWDLIADTSKGSADLILQSKSRKVHVAHLLLLTKNKRVRKQFFSKEAKRLNLPSALVKHWSCVLAARSLTDEEIGELMTQELRTPVAAIERITARLRAGNISAEILVPRHPDYYEQLVGRVDGQANIKEYADQVANEHMRRLLNWSYPGGLHHALLLCSHSAITSVLAGESISAIELDALAKWAKDADAIARTVVLELAVKRSRDRAKIGENVRALAKRFAGQGDKERYDPLELLSAAFVLVEGELGKAQILASKPPFWRRLAALAQSALIVRCVLSVAGDHSKFIEWMSSVRSHEYIVQGYVDLRLEPRWPSDFAMPRQLRNELGGRVLVVAARDEKATEKLGLRDMLLGDAPQSLKKNLNLFAMQYPGPLEGNVEFVTQLAPELMIKMRQDLSDPSPSVSSFTMVANSALLFELPQDIPELAANAIRRAEYRLNSGDKPEQLQRCLLALAMVAAIYRSRLLADEIFMVIRNYRRFFRNEIDLDDVFRIGMIACASRADLNDWCKSVAAFFTDLGFGELTREEAAALHPLLILFCEFVPELWATCGQAVAAIEAIGFP